MLFLIFFFVHSSCIFTVDISSIDHRSAEDEMATQTKVELLKKHYIESQSYKDMKQHNQLVLDASNVQYSHYDVPKSSIKSHVYSGWMAFYILWKYKIFTFIYFT